MTKTKVIILANAMTVLPPGLHLCVYQKIKIKIKIKIMDTRHCEPDLKVPSIQWEHIRRS
jgi:hypothetical protein